MTKKMEIYKCDVCGNIVEVLQGDGAHPVCCGQDMTLQEEKTADSSQEKHVPFIKAVDDGYLVKIGENQDHPMTEEHYIQWIELIVDGAVYRKELTPSDKPEATFCVCEGSDVSAREYCNIHGLWKGVL